MIVLSFGTYVYSNVLKYPHNLYLQHLSLTSHLSILTIFYGIICVASPKVVLIPMTIAYTVASVYLHFNVYNKTIKPSLC